MNNLIRVNGYHINMSTVAMLDRRPAQTFSNQTIPSGVYAVFGHGGRYWIADPEAREVEVAFDELASGKADELPY